MKNQKGITLVALILIIVLLLILAGISVTLVFNNEKEENQAPVNGITYNQQVFEESYNEYKETLVENETTTENVVDENTVSNEVTNTTNTTDTANVTENTTNVSNTTNTVSNEI